MIIASLGVSVRVERVYVVKKHTACRRGRARAELASDEG